MKHNPMSINRGLCSLEKLTLQNQKLERHKKHKKSCGHSLELLSVESNILVVSQRQICDNPLATKVWGKRLSKENDIVPPSYLLSFIFSINLVLPLLLCVISPTNRSFDLPLDGVGLSLDWAQTQLEQPVDSLKFLPIRKCCFSKPIKCWCDGPY